MLIFLSIQFVYRIYLLHYAMPM